LVFFINPKQFLLHVFSGKGGHKEEREGKHLEFSMLGVYKCILGEKKDKEAFVVPSIYLQQKKAEGQLIYWTGRKSFLQPF